MALSNAANSKRTFFRWSAGASLKKFSESGSVELGTALQENVVELQHKLKKS